MDAPLLDVDHVHKKIYGMRNPLRGDTWAFMIKAAVCVASLAGLAIIVPSHVMYMVMHRPGLASTLGPAALSSARPSLYQAAARWNVPALSRQHTASADGQSSTSPATLHATTGKWRLRQHAVDALDAFKVRQEERGRLEGRGSIIAMRSRSEADKPKMPAQSHLAQPPLRPVYVPQVRHMSPPSQTHHTHSGSLDLQVQKSPRAWQREMLGSSADMARYDHQSKGKTQPWSGDFMEAGSMEALLAARAYHKEVIITTADGNHLEEFFNLMLDFRDLHMEHTIVFMDSERSCQKAMTLMPNLGCTWASFLMRKHPQPYWTRTIHMWTMRWVLFNSVVRRGFNALILDTDNSVRMDPYMFFKSDMFTGYNQLVAYDDNVPEINCGAQYGQNIAPDGPMAWITAEVVDRLLRWTEDWSWFVDRLNVTSELHGDTFFRATFEQAIFQDASCSAMLGKPRFYHSLSPRDKQRWSFPWWDPDWQKRHKIACRWWNSTAAVALPEAWLPFARQHSQSVKYVKLRLPASHGHYPAAWGHSPFPPDRGHFSQAFQEWLRRDVPKLWTSVDADADPDGKRNKVETMAQAPLWLLSRWGEVGERLGAWNLNPPMGVINHVLVPGGRDNVLKSGIMKIYGWWHWEAHAWTSLTHELKSSEWDGETCTQGRLSANSTAMPPLIAFAPSVELLFSSSARVHATLLRSLVAAAALSHRTLVFPLVPCDSPWLAHQSARHMHQDELEATNMKDRFIVPFGPKHDLRCFWKAWACKQCHEVALPWYEFDHVLQHADRLSKRPSEGNTIFYEQLTLTRRHVNSTLAWPAGAVAARPPVDVQPQLMKVQDMKSYLDLHADSQVLWVGALFNVTDDSTELEQSLTAFDKMIQLCPEC